MAERKKSVLFLYYLFDALAFIFIIFEGAQTNLLWREGLYGSAIAAALNIAAIAAILGLHLAHKRFGAGKPRRLALLADYALFFFLTITPALLTYVVPKKGKPDFAWLPLEWHKLPENVVLLAKITPWLFAAELAVAAALIYLAGAAKKRLLPAIAAGALFALVFKQLFVLSKESNLIFYFFQYASMPLAAFIAAAAGKPRLFARAALACTFTTLLLWQYIGFAPRNPRPAQLPHPALSQIYPKPGMKPAFPLVFFRDFYVDTSRRTLFTAYGPTSGIVKLDIDSGRVKIIPTHTGLVRYIWTRDDLDKIYAVDWIRCDALDIDKKTFTARRRNIYRPDASIPLSLDVIGNRLYISTTERPGLTEYDLDTMKILRRIDLQPYTRFRSGVWRMASDPIRDKLFLELGYTDLRGENLLLRIDRKTMRIDGRAAIPAGGLELLAIPSRRRIISASFFYNSLWEFDMDSMKLLRRISGPINCRNLAYDESRGLLYATSFLGGELRAIRYSDGKTIKKLRLGNKASSLFLSPDSSTLYLGNSWGALALGLDRFLPEFKANAVR